MQDRVLIADIHDHVDARVAIAGHVSVLRNHGKVAFLDVRDRTGTLQCVVVKDNEHAWMEAERLRPESVVRIAGEVHKRPEKMINTDQPHGDVELEAGELIILSLAEELPFERNTEVNLDTLLEYRPLTLRNDREQAIFKVQHEILRAYRTFLTEEDFIEIEAPKLVGDDAEGGGNVFRLEYFKGQEAFLATSPQLYKQIMVGAQERVFAVGNVFRAEKHATSRHLNEYTSLDIEMGFIDDHTTLMALEERFMRYLTAHLRDTSEDAFVHCKASLPLLPEKSFPSMKLRQAQALIGEKTGVDKTNEPDLEPEDERWLCQYAREAFGSDFIFITHYPTSKRPFYTYEDEKDPGFTKSFDLLFRGVEITTGGQRVHTYERMVEKIIGKGLNPERFAFYLQAFKYGMPPHGGWGMGLERLTEKMLCLENVKEAALFPRDMNRIDTLLRN